MILLDPDLNFSARRQASAAKQQAGRKSSRKNLRLPSLRALKEFLARAQAAVGLRGEVSVLLTSDAAMRKLNRQFRGKNKATDVLSFPAFDSQQNHERNRRRTAGDLAISLEMACTQAATRGHSLETEIRILILHGLLHLKGFDHENDDGEMARRERTLRARLGLEQGLIERVSPPTGRVRSKSASQQVSKSATSHPSRKNMNAAKVHPTDEDLSVGTPRVGHPAVVRVGKTRGAR
jgi:probable rRNA maturation factor